MREFFRGSRRKIGVVTLLVACVFTAGWVRSLSVQDHLLLQNEWWVEVLLSVNGELGWLSLFGVPGISSWGSAKSYSLDEKLQVGPYSWMGGIRWRWRSFGFGFRELRFGQDVTLRLRTIPYWSIVIPLTAISLWLLLFKPRKSAPKKTPEPAASKGA